jgi:hypothetical protein
MKNMENLPLSNVSKGDVVANETLCPSCLMERDAKNTDCPYCGIVYSQYYRWSKEKKTKLTISGLYHLNFNNIEELQSAWAQVELMYYNQESHDRFLRLCLRLKSLPFAAHCYTERLKTFGDDEVANYQLGKVMALSREWFGLKQEASAFPVNNSLLNYTRALSMLGIFTGVVVLMLGLLTTSPIYYHVMGAFMIIGFTGIMYLLRYLKNEIVE